MFEQERTKTQVVVIGGGLAGLAAATYAARDGRRVTVLEKAQAPGGRAATHGKAGYALNLGPHALYQGGPAAEVLAELGVATPGDKPAVTGFAIDGGALRALPSGLASLLSTSLLPLRGKIELASFLAGLPSIDPASLGRTSFDAFLEARLRSPEARRVAFALARLSTYCDDFSRLDAGAAVAQMQLAIHAGVRYIDGGWATLVQGLVMAAERAGVRILAGAKAASIDRSAHGVRGVRLADGSELAADAVILAASPSLARALCPDVPHLARACEAAVPSIAACLDVALARLPAPRNTFALGIDRPLYFSVHSSAARLAPEGGAVVHVARYGKADDPGAVEAELDALLERMQPGYREVLVERRFLPSMIVAHDVPEAARGGLPGRPGPRVPGAPGIFVAGDWVGPEGMLADASLASARAAARAIDAPGKLATNAA